MTLVDSEEAAAMVRALGRPCQPATIRAWVSRGHLTAVPKVGRRLLYDLDDVQRAAAGRCHTR